MPQGCAASCLGAQGHVGRHHRAAWGVGKELVCIQGPMSRNACLLSCKLSMHYKLSTKRLPDHLHLLFSQM